MDVFLKTLKSTKKEELRIGLCKIIFEAFKISQTKKIH